MMKTTAATFLAATLALTSTAHAGGLAEPIEMEIQDIEIAAANSSSENLIIPLILLALIFAALNRPGTPGPDGGLTDGGFTTLTGG